MQTLATLRGLNDHRGSIRVEHSYATGIDDLWQACIDPSRLKN